MNSCPVIGLPGMQMETSLGDDVLILSKHPITRMVQLGISPPDVFTAESFLLKSWLKCLLSNETLLTILFKIVKHTHTHTHTIPLCSFPRLLTQHTIGFSINHILFCPPLSPQLHGGRDCFLFC
jgi:hypothetical protein